MFDMGGRVPPKWKKCYEQENRARSSTSGTFEYSCVILLAEMYINYYFHIFSTNILQSSNSKHFCFCCCFNFDLPSTHFSSFSRSILGFLLVKHFLLHLNPYHINPTAPKAKEVTQGYVIDVLCPPARVIDSEMDMV